MTDADDAFERLRATNPVTGAAPVHPDAANFIADQIDGPPDVTVVGGTPTDRAKRSWIVAAAAALLVLAGGLWLASRADSERDVIDQVEIPTTHPTPDPSTLPATATAVAPTPEGMLSDESHALVERLAATFNAGDIDDFMALLQPGLEREVVVDADRRLLSAESIRTTHAIEVDLNTHLTLECTESQDLVSCVPTRFDDLHRILEIPPTSSVAWNLRFDDDGLVRSWNERRENRPDVDAYEREVVQPFASWVRANHPEVDELYGGVAAGWTLSRRDQLIAMVAAFADSRGVELAQ